MSNTFTFGEALELAKNGVAVSATSWDFVDRLTGTKDAKHVPADQIWSPENRRIGALLVGKNGPVPVLPYTTKMTRNGIINYSPDNKDLYDTWMRSDVALRCSNIYMTEDSEEINVILEQMTSNEHLQLDLPFWMLYDQDMIGYHHRSVFIAGHRSANVLNSTLFNMLSSHIDNRKEVRIHDGFDVDVDFYGDGWMECCDENQKQYLHFNIDEHDFDIDQLFSVYLKNEYDPCNIFVDIDSLNDMNLNNGDNALEHVRAQILFLTKQYPNIHWVTFSLSEEMTRSKSLNETKKVQHHGE